MNKQFNIMQAPGVNSSKYVVIQGQRTDAGGMALGGKVISDPIEREDALELARRYNEEAAKDS